MDNLTCEKLRKATEGQLRNHRILFHVRWPHPLSQEKATKL